MSERQFEQCDGLSDLANDLVAKALSESVGPAEAVSALFSAGADILAMTFPPEVAAEMIIQSTKLALRGYAADLLTVAPAGSA